MLPTAHPTVSTVSSSSDCPALSVKKKIDHDEHGTVRPKRGKDPVYYHTYLGLDKVLEAQQPASRAAGEEAHEEMLFIIIHQTYELWFKQILHDMDSCLQIFSQSPFPEKAMSVIVSRLSRSAKILMHLVQQLPILETMTPPDFLTFRDYLFPASGFQSVQFRLIENKLGLRRKKRLKYSRADYCAALDPKHAKVVEETEHQPSLFDLVEQWLERTPCLRVDEWDWWEEYEKSVRQMFKEDEEHVLSSISDPSEQKSRLEEIRNERKLFESYFDPIQYNELLSKGKKRLSLRATKAAIMISLYRSEPFLQQPAQLLAVLMDIDKGMTLWRQNHAMMVHRMLGHKIGTGGSSGYYYLKSTVSYHKIFADFFDLSLFFVPPSVLPKLPDRVKEFLRFENDLPPLDEEESQEIEGASSSSS